MARKKAKRKTNAGRICVRCHECGQAFILTKGRRAVYICVRCGKQTTGEDRRKHLIARADVAFSRLARYERADRHGMVYCCTCGTYEHWKAVDAGHYMSRRYSATRYDLDNVWPQCKPDNSGFGAHDWSTDDTVRSRYTEFLRIKLGDDGPERLRTKALNGSLTTEDLRRLVLDLEYEATRKGLL